MKTRHIILIVAGLVVINTLLLGGLWLLRRGVEPASSQPAETTGRSHNREAAKAAAAEGYALKHSGQNAQAIAAFEAAIREDSDYSDSYHGLAQAQRDAGDPSAA